MNTFFTGCIWQFMQLQAKLRLRSNYWSRNIFWGRSEVRRFLKNGIRGVRIWWHRLVFKRTFSGLTITCLVGGLDSCPKCRWSFFSFWSNVALTRLWRLLDSSLLQAKLSPLLTTTLRCEVVLWLFGFIVIEPLYLQVPLVEVRYVVCLLIKGSLLLQKLILQTLIIIKCLQKVCFLINSTIHCIVDLALDLEREISVKEQVTVLHLLFNLRHIFPCHLLLAFNHVTTFGDGQFVTFSWFNLADVILIDFYLSLHKLQFRIKVSNVALISVDSSLL